MGTASWAQDIIIIQLPIEPRTTDELVAIAEIVADRRDCDLILDFSRVQRVTCLSLCQLVKVHKIVTDFRHRLVLCNLAAITRGIFTTYGFDRIFKGVEENIVAIEPSPDTNKNGTIVLMNNESLDRPQRRTYSRLKIPGSLKIDIVLSALGDDDQKQEVLTERSYHLQGILVDISEGGAQIAIDTAAALNFEKDQFVQLTLTTPANAMTAVFEAQIRELLPTADDKYICLGLKYREPETTLIGRQVLQQLHDSVGRYYQTEPLKSV